MTLVLPADVYDTLEFSALVYGGIGAGTSCSPSFGPDGLAVPVCGIGHLALAGAAELSRAYFSFNQNDIAVIAVNRRNCRPVTDRIPFPDWCAELNVVRGDA